MANPSFKRLYRSRRDRVIGGVCGGLGDYFSFDPVLVRVIWLATILFGGTGILAYIVAWILIPEKPYAAEIEGEQWDKPEGERGRETSRVLGIILIVIAAILLFSQFNWFPYFPWGWIWPVALAVLGVALLLRPKIIERGEYETYKPGPVDPGSTSAGEGEADSPDEKPPGQEGEHHRTFRRSRGDRVIFGVCGGIAKRLGVDPLVIRLFWALATVFSVGFFLLAYILLAIFIPEEY